MRHTISWAARCWTRTVPTCKAWKPILPGRRQFAARRPRRPWQWTPRTASFAPPRPSSTRTASSTRASGSTSGG
eukprot:6814096-Alexandrium_andersonii.AAC.1